MAPNYAFRPMSADHLPTIRAADGTDRDASIQLVLTPL
jgi:hypothetical protein